MAADRIGLLCMFSWVQMKISIPEGIKPLSQCSGPALMPFLGKGRQGSYPRWRPLWTWDLTVKLFPRVLCERNLSWRQSWHSVSCWKEENEAYRPHSEGILNLWWRKRPWNLYWTHNKPWSSSILYSDIVPSHNMTWSKMLFSHFSGLSIILFILMMTWDTLHLSQLS